MDVNGGDGEASESRLKLEPHHLEVRPSFLRTLAYVLMAMMFALGLWRVEDTADKAEVVAQNLAVAEERDDRLQAANELESCQTRNTFQRNTRNKFDRYNDAIELLLLQGQTDPDRIARTKVFVASLRASVETKPEDEDRDCNGDAEFDEADYLP